MPRRNDGVKEFDYEKGGSLSEFRDELRSQVSLTCFHPMLGFLKRGFGLNFERAFYPQSFYKL